MDDLVVGVGSSKLGELLDELSTSFGIETQYFSESIDAIATIERLQPTIVIAAEKMEEIDGISFLCRAKRISPVSVPIIFDFKYLPTTATAKDLQLFACIGAGMDTDLVNIVVQDALSYASMRNVNEEFPDQYPMWCYGQAANESFLTPEPQPKASDLG